MTKEGRKYNMKINGGGFKGFRKQETSARDYYQTTHWRVKELSKLERRITKDESSTRKILSRTSEENKLVFDKKSELLISNNMSLRIFWTKVTKTFVSDVL